MAKTKNASISVMRRCITSLLLLSGVVTAYADAGDAGDFQPSSSLTQQQQVNTVMCVYCSAEADGTTPGCFKYTTPLDACYNGQALFPHDPSWSDSDIHDTMVYDNIKRKIYPSKDGSCKGKIMYGDDTNAGEEPYSFMLPLDECVGPFGPPRPYGKFSLSKVLIEEE